MVLFYVIPLRLHSKFQRGEIKLKKYCIICFFAWHGKIYGAVLLQKTCEIGQQEKLRYDIF